jgi:hypothetical protein
MRLIVHLNDTPWIDSPANFTTIRSMHSLIGTNNGKWNFARNFFSLRNGLLILIFVSGCLENVNVMMGNVGENLGKTVSENCYVV